MAHRVPPLRRAAALVLLVPTALACIAERGVPEPGASGGGDVVHQPAPPLRPSNPDRAAVPASGAAPGQPQAPAPAPEGAVAGDRASAALAAAQEAARSPEPKPAPLPTPDAQRRAIAATVDDWHRAASEADWGRYFGHMTDDAVFLGTDRTERWDMAAFRSYVDSNTEPGQGWTFVPVERFVTLGPDRRVAWFDERLASATFGDVRGTGVLRLEGATWRIAHYSLTFTIPNAVRRDVVEVVRGAPR